MASYTWHKHGIGWLLKDERGNLVGSIWRGNNKDKSWFAQHWSVDYFHGLLKNKDEAKKWVEDQQGVGETP